MQHRFRCRGKTWIIVVFAAATFAALATSCLNPRAGVITDQLRDPTFDFSRIRQVWFVPSAQSDFAKQKGMSELLERNIYFIAKGRLEKAGYEVSVIDTSLVSFRPEGSDVHDAAASDDRLFLYVDGYLVHDTSTTAKSALGILNADGSGFYSSSGPSAQVRSGIFVNLRLLTSEGHRLRTVWQASALQGDVKGGLGENTSAVLDTLLRAKPFPSRKKP